MPEPAAEGALIRFIRTNTTLAAPPLVPELRLHLATEITPIWHATERELAQIGLAPPYWAFCWPGGQALARFLLDHPHLAAGRRVLDFGSGGGVAGLAAARAGGVVECADVDPVARAAIALNAAVNVAAVRVRAGDALAEGLAGAWDLVLAGDVFYEQPMAARLAAWLARLTAAGTTILIGDPGRSYLPATGLERLATYDVPTSLELEDRPLRRTTIWRVVGDLGGRPQSKVP